MWRLRVAVWRASSAGTSGGDAKHKGADRGTAAQSRVDRGVRQCPRAVARRHVRRVPAGHLLAPAVRLGAGVRGVISTGALKKHRTPRADTARCRGCLVASSHRPIDQRGTRRPQSRAIRRHRLVKRPTEVTWVVSSPRDPRRRLSVAPKLTP